MANLKLDDSGRPIPQIQNDAGTDFVPWKGENNAGRVVGDIEHDAVDTGKPVKIGGKAVDPAALPADVAAADRVNALFDLKGRLFVRLDGDIDVSSTSLGNIVAGTINLGAISGYTISLNDLFLGNIYFGSVYGGAFSLGEIDLGGVQVGTTLAAILNKIIAAPATEAKQDTIIGYIDTLETLLTAIKDTDGIKKITDALPAGTNNIGDIDVLTLPATNQEGTALASAARAATTSSDDISNNHKNGVHVVLDVTAITDTPSVTLKIEGQDPASGKYYTVLEGAAVTTISTNIYKVFPAATAATNSVANDIIPKTWRVTVTHADADSITYSVGYSLM